MAQNAEPKHLIMLYEKLTNFPHASWLNPMTHTKPFLPTHAHPECTISHPSTRPTVHDRKIKSEHIYTHTHEHKTPDLMAQISLQTIAFSQTAKAEHHAECKPKRWAGSFGLRSAS